MKYRRYLACLGLILASMASSPDALADEVSKPNILWIIAEDMSPDLGCYGNAVVTTPNIDGLAAKGMRFNRVFTTAPACSPSRTAMATGVYQTTLGAHHMRYSKALMPQLPEGIKTLPQMLRERGYYTGNIRGIAGTGMAKDDWQFKHRGKRWDTKSWEELVKNQPFYAQINSSESHRRFASTKGINAEDIRLPPYYPDHPVTRHDFAGYFAEVNQFDAHVGKILKLLDDQGLSENTIVCVLSDHGRPMIRGKNWLYDSGIHIPLVIYIPEGLKKPARYRPGTTDDSLTLSIDLVAQTIQMAGGTPPDWMQGRPFLASNTEPRQYLHAAADRFGDVDSCSRSVRTHRYKYIRNFKQPGSINESSTAYRRSSHPIYHLLNIMGEKNLLTPEQSRLLAPLAPEELYDLEKDPYETVNLIGDEAYQAVHRELKAKMQQWIDASKDQGIGPDSEALIKHFEDYGVKTLKARREKIEEMRLFVEQHFEE
ncbi:MAG: sulfatase [Phycisphaeraceae bacterium]|nr:sulfatase [Phycisphaeraceae bacterium]